MTRRHIWYALLLATIAGLAFCSVQLARIRIYQVDECQNIYMARVFATGQAAEFFTNSSLFLFGPLSWLTRYATGSAELFTSARLLFLGGFWLNLFLLAAIASRKLLSLPGLIALTAAATLAPLWDYGFEIRHDNLVLTGVLLIWWTVRVKPLGLYSYALAGIVTVMLLFTAVKTVVYALPLSFAILAFPSPDFKRPRWQLGLVWLGGAVLATAVIRLGYGTDGAWENYLSVFRRVTTLSASSTTGDGGNRFLPWSTLARLLGQSPLLVALTTAACYAVSTDLVRRRRNALNWEGNLPELLLMLGALAALCANPTPFPYNLLHFVPYAFLLSFSYARTLWKTLAERSSLWPVAGMVIVVVHLVPFCVASIRHLDRPNIRQRQLMMLAEEFTDPVKDPVYDAIGMVPTRRSIHFQWYLHSLNIRGVVNTPGSRVREMLAARPAAVFIPSYRTSWLPPEDHEFISQRYVPLADDFWVLGTVLPAGGGNFEIFHPGRYLIDTLPRSGIIDTNKPNQITRPTAGDKVNLISTLNGKPVTNGPVELAVGNHHLEVPGDLKVAVVWLGPKFNSPPPIAPGDQRILFLNWY